ncbi:Methionine aminopeptidase 1D, mitochondrial [Rhizophlyctis rosea]|uniref:Methionine aminopeptidase 1D, mitochondrial n=1 Tax=Rhizophlyctis rosea TaxID=64517 RepID=A0AAD5SJ11_9FUNG|nr:Methionine aminopeptidase 1D, mitochondrial [Rhizophlyctis rosea]
MLQVFLNGFHGDTSATFLVGEVDQKGVDLVGATKEAMHRAIQACGPGVPLNTIGQIISDFAKMNGYTTCREFSGHGLGRQFHEVPLIYHFANDDDMPMMEGMAFTIDEIIKWPDEWTVVTKDGEVKLTIVLSDSVG